MASERIGTRSIRVVIAYDVRCFQDLGGQLIDDVPNPILGMSSRNFAEMAAEMQQQKSLS